MKAYQEKNLSVKRVVGLLYIVILAFCILPVMAFGEQKVDSRPFIEKGEDPVVTMAYELRMAGRADSAKQVLENLLAEDSTNAMAWFELTRTLDHLGLANPRQMIEEHKHAIHAASQAVKYAPDNAYFLSYLGSEKALSFYIDIMTGKTEVADKLADVEDTYLRVLELDPTYYEVKITLVELYGSLPPEMGGDKEKAEKYTLELEAEDAFAGAVAREILLGEDVDRVTYWEGQTDLPETAELYARICRTHIAAGNIDKAAEYVDKATKLNSEMNILYLDMARYYLYQAMQDPTKVDSLYAFMEVNYMKYINSDSTPNTSTRAWAYGGLARLNMRMGNQEKGKEFMEKANALDPFFSKASGVPSQALFVPPDKVVKGHGYFFRPF